MEDVAIFLGPLKRAYGRSKYGEEEARKSIITKSLGMDQGLLPGRAKSENRGCHPVVSKDPGSVQAHFTSLAQELSLGNTWDH